MPRDFFGIKGIYRKRAEMSAGKSVKPDTRSYIPLYESLPGAVVVYDGNKKSINSQVDAGKQGGNGNDLYARRKHKKRARGRRPIKKGLK